MAAGWAATRREGMKERFTPVYSTRWVRSPHHVPVAYFEREVGHTEVAGFIEADKGINRQTCGPNAGP